MNSIAWSVSNHRHPASGNKTNHESMNPRSEEHTSELQSLRHLVCRLLLEKKKKTKKKRKNRKPRRQPRTGSSGSNCKRKEPTEDRCISIQEQRPTSSKAAEQPHTARRAHK